MIPVGRFLQSCREAWLFFFATRTLVHRNLKSSNIFDIRLDIFRVEALPIDVGGTSVRSERPGIVTDQKESLATVLECRGALEDFSLPNPFSCSSTPLQFRLRKQPAQRRAHRKPTSRARPPPPPGSAQFARSTRPPALAVTLVQVKYFPHDTKDSPQGGKRM